MAMKANFEPNAQDDESVGGKQFTVSVQYCRNHTWQGTLQWKAGRQTRCFRSELELLKLIDSALAAR